MTDLDPALWQLPPGLSARLVQTDADHAPAAEALSPTEVERMQSFGHLGRRREFALGRTAVRTLAAERLSVMPRDVALVVADDGAPEVPGMYVSIAHTGRNGRSAALASVADQAVGVDLEEVAPRRSDLWRRILSPTEQPILDALGGPTDDVQTLLWTIKEAVLKGQRTGLRAGGRAVHLKSVANDAGSVSDQGVASAVARGPDGVADWRIAFGRRGVLWLAVAWRLDTEAEWPGVADGSRRFGRIGPA